MIRRLFWVGLGVAVGVVVVRKLTRAAESYSPRGLAESARGSLAGTMDSVRDFFDDARAAMADREAELETALESGEDIDEVFDSQGRHHG